MSSAPEGAPLDGCQFSTHALLASFDARIETVSLDRHTGLATNCCGDRLTTSEADPDGEPLVHSGYLSIPLDAQRRDYPLWDVQLRRAQTARFAGEENRYGIRTCVFRVTTPLTRVGVQELPGVLFDQDTPSVTAVSEYAGTRTMWIEPASSQVIDLRNEVTQQFRYGDRVVPATSAEFTTPPPSAEVLAQARQAAQVLPWLRWRGSALPVAVGVALALAAARSRARRVPSRRRAG